jgi:hydrogenase maturation factor HypE
MDPDYAALMIEEGVRKRLVVKETYEDRKRDWAQHVEFQEAEEKETNERDRAVFHEVKRQAQEQGPDSLAAEQFRSLQQARREAQGSRGRRR